MAAVARLGGAAAATASARTKLLLRAPGRRARRGTRRRNVGWPLLVLLLKLLRRWARRGARLRNLLLRLRRNWLRNRGCGSALQWEVLLRCLLLQGRLSRQGAGLLHDGWRERDGVVVWRRVAAARSRLPATLLLLAALHLCCWAKLRCRGDCTGRRRCGGAGCICCCSSYPTLRCRDGELVDDPAVFRLAEGEQLVGPREREGRVLDHLEGRACNREASGHVLHLVLRECGFEICDVEVAVVDDLVVAYHHSGCLRAAA